MSPEDLEKILADYENKLAARDIRISRLEAAARALRNAQRAYMSNRGNQELGKQVAIKARELDDVLNG